MEFIKTYNELSNSIVKAITVVLEKKGGELRTGYKNTLPDKKGEDRIEIYSKCPKISFGFSEPFNKVFNVMKIFKISEGIFFILENKDFKPFPIHSTKLSTENLLEIIKWLQVNNHIPIDKSIEYITLREMENKYNCKDYIRL